MIKQISVIIPVFNEEKYIAKCIESIVKQSIKPFEIIVVDDGSIDNTSAIAKKYGINIFKLKHGGTGQAKNYGASKAKGEILIFIDADMYLDKDYIKNIISPILKEKCICTYTTAEYVKNTKNIWAKCWNINGDLPENKRVSTDKDYKEFAFRAILKREFDQTKGYNPSWGYFDDGSLSQFGIFSKAVNNAICYHYNPETLKEVIISARWIGRSKKFELTFRNIMKYSILNSLRIAFRKVKNGAPLAFIIFKLIFDYGIVIGMFSKTTTHNYAK